MKLLAQNYLTKLKDTLDLVPLKNINHLIKQIHKLKKNNKKLYICGNGGSAANAIHIANDFIFTKSSKKKMINVEALTANNAIITCISNDVGYKYIFSKQLENKANCSHTWIRWR